MLQCTLPSQLHIPWTDVHQDLHCEAMAQQWSARKALRVTLWWHLMQWPYINTIEYHFLIWWLLISIHPVAIGSFVSYGCLFVNKYFKIPFIDSLNCMQMTCILFAYTQSVQATPVTWMNHMLLWPPLPNILLFSFKCPVNNTLSCKYYRVLVTAEWNVSMEHWQHDTERGKLKYSEKNLSQCHCGHHKSYIDRPRIKSLPLQSERPLINHLCNGMAVYSLLLYSITVTGNYTCIQKLCCQLKIQCARYHQTTY